MMSECNEVSAKMAPFDPEEAGAECLFRFGETGALLFWIYCLLSSGKRKDLAAWGEKLLAACCNVNPVIRHKRKNKAGHPLTNLTKIDRGLASRWARANPLPPINYQPSPTDIANGQPTPPNSILLLPLFFCGEGEDAWQSHLLVIYDRQTRTLYHRFLTLRPNVKLTADWILQTFSLALSRIVSTPEEANFCIMPALIQMPVQINEATQQLAPYSEAIGRLTTALLAGKDCCASWLRRDPVRIQTTSLLPVCVASQEVTQVTLGFTTARELETVVTRISHQFQNNDHSSWISLTPPKAIKRLDPNRFAKPKPACTPPASKLV